MHTFKYRNLLSACSPHRQGCSAMIFKKTSLYGGNILSLKMNSIIPLLGEFAPTLRREVKGWVIKNTFIFRLRIFHLMKSERLILRLRGLRSPLSLLAASLTSPAGCGLPLPSLPQLPVLHSYILHLISYIYSPVCCKNSEIN